MNFRNSVSTRRVEAVIDITSLVDVVFLLLIFLLVTTTFKKKEHAFVLDLPTATHTELVVHTDTTTVYITQQGEYFLLEIPDGEDATEGDMTRDGSRMNADALEARLKKLAEDHPDAELAVRAQRDTSYQKVVDVLDVCRKVGLSNVLLPAEYVGGGAPGGGADETAPGKPTP